MLHRRKALIARSIEVNERGPRDGVWAELLGFHDIRGLRALGAFDDIKFDVLAFLQRFEPISFKGGIMNKHVLTGFQPDKAKSLAIVEPFDSALGFHTALLCHECSNMWYRTADQSHITASSVKP
jgi:hypothetical protein